MLSIAHGCVAVHIYCSMRDHIYKFLSSNKKVYTSWIGMHIQYMRVRIWWWSGSMCIVLLSPKSRCHDVKGSRFANAWSPVDPCSAVSHYNRKKNHGVLSKIWIAVSLNLQVNGKHPYQHVSFAIPVHLNSQGWIGCRCGGPPCGCQNSSGGRRRVVARISVEVKDDATWTGYLAAQWSAMLRGRAPWWRSDRRRRCKVDSIPGRAVIGDGDATCTRSLAAQWSATAMQRALDPWQRSDRRLSDGDRLMLQPHASTSKGSPGIRDAMQGAGSADY
jgi:hypothetical protein